MNKTGECDFIDRDNPLLCLGIYAPPNVRETSAEIVQPLIRQNCGPIFKARPAHKTLYIANANRSLGGFIRGDKNFIVLLVVLSRRGA